MAEAGQFGLIPAVTPSGFSLASRSTSGFVLVS
jgi:hypothetical protein